MFKNKAHKVVVVSALAVVAFASLGTSYYLFNNSKISADTGVPALPPIPGSIASTPTTGTNNSTISMPPIPPAPSNNSTTANIYNTPSSSSSSSSLSNPYDTSVNSYSSNALNEDQTTIADTSTGLPASISDATETSLDDQLSASNEITQEESIADSNSKLAANLNTPIGASQASENTNSRMFGLIAAAISAISFLALVFLLLKSKKPTSPSLEIPQI